MNRKVFLRLLGAGTVGVASGFVSACTSTASNPSAPAASHAKNWAWVSGSDQPPEAWEALWTRMRSAGIDAVLLHERIDDLADRIRAARQAGLEVHLWKITMMQGGMEDEHPEWYAVNRNGAPTATDPPYVDYYKFLCPSREPVQQLLVQQVTELAQLEGVTSIHLDYIRYPDVILPVALWPKYDLVQDREYPEFDYCYCDVCRAAFEEQSGVDPLDLEDPPSHDAWLHYRYDSITHVVNLLADAAHAHDTQITAAVFPTPEIARKLVRQDWTRWPLDAVLPMIYHSFYNEDVAWIETATREGVAALQGAFPLYSGLFVPELTPDELAQAVERARAGGANGIVLFQGWTLTETHWQALGQRLRR